MKSLTIATFISNNEKCNENFFKFIEYIQKELSVKVIIFTDQKIENINHNFKQIVKNKTTKYKRIIQLIKLSETNNILCIDNDITIDYKNLKNFITEFIDSKYAIGWGKIRTININKFIPQLIKIDKNLSHDFIRPLLWKLKLGISIPGQIFALKKDKFIDKLPKIDTVYDDLTIGMIARKNNFEYFYSKSYLGSEFPKGNFIDLIKQRIRWSKGMAQSIFNGIKYNMLNFVLIHAFMYHMLWIPYYILLFIISKYNLIFASILFLLVSMILSEVKIKDILWAICYMLIFPIIHSIWFIFFIYNIIRYNLNSL